MRKEIVSLLVGMVVGIVFTAFRLPLPAPNALSGVLGVSGIYFGNKLANLVVGNWDKIVSALS